MSLLDSLNTDEARMGLGLLAAGGYQSSPMSFGQRIQMAMQGEDARKQSGQKSKLLDMQMKNYESEIEARKLAGIKDARQQSMIESLFGPTGGQTSPNAGNMQPPASGMQPLPMTGAPPQSGQLGTAQPGDATSGATHLQTQGQAPNLVEYARSLGIPEQAIKTDMVFNGGKGIAAMLEKRGTPDMQVSNGFAYDKNKVNAGFMPSLSTSTNGQTSMTRIGPDGMPFVSAPRGALETYGAYKGMDAGLTAAGKVNLRKNPDGTETPVSEIDENPTLRDMLGIKPATTAAKPGYAAESQMKTTVAGDIGGARAQVIAQIEANKKAMMQPMDEKSRQLLREDIAFNQKKLEDPLYAESVQKANAPPAYGMTNQQASNAKAASQFGEKLATEQADLLGKSFTAAGDAASEIIGVQQARKAMQSGAFSGTGAELKLSIAKFGGAIGIPINAEKATNTDYLKSVLGQGLLDKARSLGANPSNADANRISDIVGTIGKDPQAMSKILDWREEMSHRSIKSHNSKVEQATTSGYVSPYDMRVNAPEGIPLAKPSTPPAIPMKGMVRNGYKFKGGDPASQASWEKQ